MWRFLRNRRLLLCLHTIFRALIYWAHRAVILAIAWHLVAVGDSKKKGRKGKERYAMSQVGYISAIYVKKTTVLNALETMTMTSDVENSKN